MTDATKHLVVNCSSTTGEIALVGDGEVDGAVKAIAGRVRDAETRAVADWRAQQAEAQRRRSVDLAAHGEAMARRAVLQGRINEIAERDEDLKVVLQALGLVES